jgi:hypothetical protein
MGYQIFSTTDFSKPMLTYKFDASQDSLIKSDDANIRKVLFRKLSENRWILAFLMAHYDEAAQQ